MKHYLLTGMLLGILLSRLAAASQPVFLGDNNTSITALYDSSDFTRMGEHVYFRAEGPFGCELYRSNLLTNTVELVKDIYPGPANSMGSDSHFTLYDGHVYFYANDGVHGSEVWRTDGTSSGTQIFFDAAPGRAQGRPNYTSNEYNIITAGNGLLYFVGGSDSPRQLYKSDGTIPGTTSLTGTSIPDGDGRLCVAGSYTYFTSYDPATGTELWRTDGTDAGTTLVKDIIPGSASPQFDNMTPYGNELYFTSITYSQGERLFKTDGTAAGTIMLSSVTVSANANIAVVNGVTYFISGNYRQLFKAPGTAESSEFIKDLRPTRTASPIFLKAFGEEVIFNAANDNGEGLWRSDGTSSGTFMFKSFPGRSSTATAYNEILTGSNTVYVIRQVENFGSEIWISDGTEAGTFHIPGLALKEINVDVPHRTMVSEDLYFSTSGEASAPNPYRLTRDTTEVNPLTPEEANASASFESGNFIRLGNQLLFSGRGEDTGVEPWITDGTPDGTHILADLVPGAGNSNPSSFIRSGNHVVFTVKINGLYGLASSDGTPSGTSIIQRAAFPAIGLDTVEIDELSYWVALDPPYGFPLPNPNVWRTDGTESGTVRLQKPLLSNPSSLLRKAGDTAYILVRTSYEGFELWKMDNSTSTLTMVKDITPGPGSSFSTSFLSTEFDGSLYFQASDPVHGNELWKTDGTSAGTTLVADIALGSASSDVSPGPVLADKLYFSCPSDNGWDLWATDGTSVTTQMVHSAVTSSTFFFDMAHVPGSIGALFTGGDEAHGDEPWISDGSLGGTTLLTDINLGQASSHSRLYRSAGGVVYFVANDGEHGEEIWISDGTSMGTYMALDIRSGVEGSGIMTPTVINDKLYFSADDGVHGRELWMADPETDSITMIADLETGSGDSTPSEFHALEDTLIFKAYTSTTGMDLWALTIADISAIDDWQLYE